MKKRQISLLSFLLLTSLYSWGEVYHTEIRWEENPVIRDHSGNWLHFENAAYAPSNTFLPYYHEVIIIEDESVEVNLRNIQCVPLNQPVQFLGKDQVPLTVLLNTQKIEGAGKKMLSVSCIPVFQDDEGIKLVTSFDIEISSGKLLKSANEVLTSASNSVLSSGNWIKVKTSGSGIHKLTYPRLNSMGIDHPEDVRIYGNGGYGLPLMNGEIYPDDLSPVPILKGKDGNGINCIWFYVSGPVKIYYDESNKQLAHLKNFYSDYAYYFITDDAGAPREIETAEEIPGIPNDTISSYDDFKYYDEDTYNLIESGRRWFGQLFVGNSSATFTFDFNDILTGEEVNVEVTAAGRSSENSAMDIAIDGEKKGQLIFLPVNMGSKTDKYADVVQTVFKFIPSSANINVDLSYVTNKSSAKCWIDYIRITARRELKLNGSQLTFRDIKNRNADTIIRYELSGASSTTKIWDVSDIWNPIEIPAALEGDKLIFKVSANVVGNYVAFDTKGNFAAPDIVGSVENQNLHGDDPMDMIIVTHPDFLTQANELAQFHENEQEPLKVKVVTPQEIYNEFSSGAPDVAAIRNYAKMWYNRTKDNSGTKLRYLLLMGDGSWDNKSEESENPNYILTYQSSESLYPTSSFVSDDFFGLLDTDEGEYIGYLDIGVGRIPCNSAAEAQLLVNKIKNYASAAAHGSWRNVLTFIADDGDGNLHMSQAETLTDQVSDDYPAFILNKIYLDAYQQVNTSGGQRYPAVNEAITKAVDEGTLLLNYTGHAGYRGMADESVLEIGEIDSWTNYNKLPIFVTATCEFSRFDLKEEASAGEHILMNPKGGGIALFSTTRLVFSGPNFNLNKWFYKFVFEQDENGNNYRMGDIMRLTKVASGTGTNKRNFTLLGDPALRISYPRYHVKTTYLNGISSREEIPILPALSEVDVEGEITDHRGERLSGFDGEIISMAYDKEQVRSTLGNDDDPFDFSVRENILFKGESTVSSGEFNFSFMIPKDISYNLGSGKICYYASDNEVDAQGYDEDFLIGGGTASGINDHAGPDISLYMNDTTFVSGGKVNDSPWLIAYIKDESGINTVGTGIGHDITVILDGDNANVLVLNNYFKSDKDLYNSGQIIFPLSGLEEGEHTLTLKVWDVLNNSSIQEIDFVVADELSIRKLICYPNPASYYTRFRVEHNNPGEIFDVKIKIYSFSGILIDEIEKQVISNGVTIDSIEWDFSSRGLNPGIYCCNVIITNSEGVTESKTSRLVISSNN